MMTLPITPDMMLGRTDFAQTIFVLKSAVTPANCHQFMTANQLTPEPLDDVAWFLPAYLSADYNLFFILAPNFHGHWAITCSQVQIEPPNRIVAMSETVSTGMGLNAVNQIDPTAALSLVAYLKTLEANGWGYFTTQEGSEKLA